MATTNALAVDTTRFATALDKLKAEAAAIIVNSPQSCLIAKTTQRGLRNYMKDVHSALDPFVNMTKRAYDDARDERQRWLGQAEIIDDTLAGKVKDFERKERERSEREEQERNRLKREAEAREAEYQRKIREAQAAEERKAQQKQIEEARKAGDLNKREAERMKREVEKREAIERERAKQEEEAAKANFVPDKVLPNIPTVQGVPSRINYKAEVTHPERLINAYVDAVALRNTERAVYLRRFIMVNEQALGLEARTVKNSKKLEAEIPGVRFYEE